MTWMDDELEWNWGIKAIYNGTTTITSTTSTASGTSAVATTSGGGSGSSKTIKNNSNRCLLRNSLLDFTDVEIEKQQIGESDYDFLFA